MAAAAEIGCSFCLDLNYFLAHDRGLDAAKAREVPRWRESTVFSPVAVMNRSARMNISLGIGSEHFADSCGLPPIATGPTGAPAP